MTARTGNRWQRRDIVFALGAGLVAGRGRAAAAPGEFVQWPEVTLLDGARWVPAPGRAQVIVFWSTTCPFCERHNRHIEKLHRAAQDQALAVLGVSRDADPALVRRSMAQHGHTFAVTMDHAKLAAALSPRKVIPLTITIDRDGRLKQAIPGEMFEDDVMELLRLAA